MMRFLLLALTFIGPSTLSGAVAAEWNEAVLDAVRPQSPAPLLLARNLAIMHRSMADVIFLTAESGNAPHFFEKSISTLERPSSIDPSTAAAFAAHKIATRLFPSGTPLFNELLAAQTEGLTKTEKSAAQTLGVRCATIHLEARKADRLSSTLTYFPQKAPGQWRRTPPNFRPPELPHGRLLKPFAIESLESLLPPPPPDLGSSKWVVDFKEVDLIGAKDSPRRTEEESIIARFWSDFNYTITPPGHWNQIAIEILGRKATTLAEEAKILAWLNTALVDAGIVCWKAKYRYNFWRPITAIQEAETDRSEETVPNKDWTPYLINPPHPEYPSGHSSFSGSAAHFLRLAFGTDEISFSSTSDSVPGHKRSFTSLWACAEEISASRIYGGIHYRFSGDAGLEAGKQVAEDVYQLMMQSGN